MSADCLARRRETPLLPVLVWTRLINVGTLVRAGRTGAVHRSGNDYDTSHCIPDQLTIEDNPDIQDQLAGGCSEFFESFRKCCILPIEV